MGTHPPANGGGRVNPWPFLLGAYLLAAVSLLLYLLSVGRRTRAMAEQVAAMRRRLKGTAT
jgi:hypothetical protein